MAGEISFTEEEKENMLEMLTDTLYSLIGEKLEHPVWKEKVKKIEFKINLEIPGAGVVHFILEKGGNYTIDKGAISDPIIEIQAPLERFFNFSSRQLSTFSVIFLGKLKIKGKRHLATLLNLGKVLRIIPEKDLKK
ncbi:MAG: SCP2 sterol-binding domain-containing protein [Candidatus Helarchaeota archaeon]